MRTVPGALSVTAYLVTIGGVVGLIGWGADRVANKTPLLGLWPSLTAVLIGVGLMILSGVLLKRRFLSLASGSGLTADDAEALWREADEDDEPRQTHNNRRSH